MILTLGNEYPDVLYTSLDRLFNSHHPNLKFVGVILVKDNVPSAPQSEELAVDLDIMDDNENYGSQQEVETIMLKTPVYNINITVSSLSYKLDIIRIFQCLTMKRTLNGKYAGTDYVDGDQFNMFISYNSILYSCYLNETYTIDQCVEVVTRVRCVHMISLYRHYN